MDRYIWEELIFTGGEIRTDPLLYWEKVHLLLPDRGEENAFLAVCTRTSRRFYIGSTSPKTMERLHAFFFRIYNVIFEPARPPDGFDYHIRIRNLRRNRNLKDFYHPRFVRNLMDMGSVREELVTAYMVTLRSRISPSGKRRYNFVTRVSFTSNGDMISFSDLVRDEIRHISDSSRWKMKIWNGRRITDDLLVNPMNLINFVRIPAETDFII